MNTMTQLHTGMDMGMGDMDSSNISMASTDIMTMMMNMRQFHASGGDTLWISPFDPSSPSAVFGACVLLFFIGILSRFIEAIQRTTTLIWASRQSGRGATVTWNARHELPRGALFLFQAGIIYLLMLAVMTYNAYFFISILIGLGIGETCFGRFGRPTLQCGISDNTAKDSDSAEAIVNCCEKGQ